MTRMLVTITPPTPNGGIHLGHLAGPFLAGDVFARAQRQLGHEVVLVCYSDDHQSYLARKARELGQSEEAVCGRYADEIDTTLSAAGVRLDHFMRSRDNPLFQRVVGEHLALMRSRGAVTRERRPVPYCQFCELYGYEAYARGHCNVCGALSDASQCEECASAPDVAQMQGLHCTQCKRPTGWREAERLVLDLGRYRETLAQAHAAAAMRPQLARFMNGVLGSADLRWPIDRPNEHGVPVDHPDGGRDVLSTWFSGLAGYRACFEEYALKQGGPEAVAPYVSRYWASPDTVFAHFLGYDCSFSHAVAYRAILSELPSGPQQAYFYTNAFLKLDDTDFSTSRGHAIWARDILKTVSADLLRHYLTRVSPEDETSNFSSADFARWQPAAERQLADLERCAAQVGPVRLEADDIAPLSVLRARWRSATSLQHFSVRALSAVVTDAKAFAWARAQRGSAGRGAALAALAAFARPTMPEFSARLLGLLQVDADRVDQWLAHEQPLDSVFQRVDAALAAALP